MYYCNGTVVGVKTSDMDFYVAMKDVGMITWSSANSSCNSYTFCGNAKGTLPTIDQLLSIYNNKSAVDTLLVANGGTRMEYNGYWSSTGSNCTGTGSGYGCYLLDMVTGEVSLDRTYGSSRRVRPVLTSW